jgi:hypothetical protein
MFRDVPQRLPVLYRLTQDAVFCIVVLLAFVIVRPHNVVYYTRLVRRLDTALTRRGSEHGNVKHRHQSRIMCRRHALLGHSPSLPPSPASPGAITTQESFHSAPRGSESIHAVAARPHSHPQAAPYPHRQLEMVMVRRSAPPSQQPAPSHSQPHRITTSSFPLHVLLLFIGRG